jgi:hypothetical protein
MESDSDQTSLYCRWLPHATTEVCIAPVTATGCGEDEVGSVSGSQAHTCQVLSQNVRQSLRH